MASPLGSPKTSRRASLFSTKDDSPSHSHEEAAALTNEFKVQLESLQSLLNSGCELEELRTGTMSFADEASLSMATMHNLWADAQDAMLDSQVVFSGSG